jgi:hypothetical protein
VWPERNAKRRRWKGDLVLSRKAQRCSSNTRLLTAFVLFFLGFQFSRFYLSVPLDSHICPLPAGSEMMPTHEGPSHSVLQHHAPSGTESGPAFQHCKDYVDGMGLTLAQPMPVPAETSFPWEQPVSYISLSSPLPAPQKDLASPFHPPRHRS